MEKPKYQQTYAF